MGELGPHLTRRRWAEAYLCTKCHLDPSSHLATTDTTDMGQKLGALPPFGEVSWFPSNTMWPGLRTTCMLSFILIHPVIWPQQIWAENLGLCPLLGKGELGAHLSPSNTIWPGPRPTCKPSFILIYTTGWLQYTNVTDRTDK